MRNKEKFSKILAGAIVALFVAACILLARCPDELPEAPAELPAASAAPVAADTTAVKKARHRSRPRPMPPIRPRSRDFLDDAVKPH